MANELSVEGEDFIECSFRISFYIIFKKTENKLKTKPKKPFIRIAIFLYLKKLILFLKVPLEPNKHLLMCKKIINKI